MSIIGMGKKVARLKADMANDLLIREINEHQFKVKIRILEENARLLRRRLWIALASGFLLGLLVGLFCSQGFLNGCIRAIGEGVAKGLCGVYG